jgi:hypothetical protein
MFEHAALGGISDNEIPLSRVCITDSERLDMPRQAVHGVRVPCVATPPILLNHADARLDESPHPSRRELLFWRSGSPVVWAL